MTNAITELRFKITFHGPPVFATFKRGVNRCLTTMITTTTTMTITITITTMIMIMTTAMIIIITIPIYRRH